MIGSEPDNHDDEAEDILGSDAQSTTAWLSRLFFCSRQRQETKSWNHICLLR